jgi:multidrug efflux pump subunit AcrA (membrane-fusion protein)
MRFLFAKNFLWYLILLIIGGGALWYGYTEYSLRSNPVVRESATVTLDSVSQSITVSGKVEAKQVARLGFPVTGSIKQVLRTEGDTVNEGDIIASLTNDSVVAEYNAALEQVRFQTETREQLINGATPENRIVAETNIAVAKAALAKATAEYDTLVENARQTLLSNDLTAYPVDPINDDVPPTISGNYLCEAEGVYRLSLFGSGVLSGRSYTLTGLSTGTFAANTDTASPLGTCGLFIQFSASETYRLSDWVVEVPNKRSPTYVTVKNAYELAKTQRTTAIKAAEEAVTLAENSRDALIATPTREAIAQANANIAAAEARLTAIEARIADYTIRAPFPGVVTSVDMKVGEAVGPNHTVTIVYEGDYELKARIPEIDIKKVELTDAVTVIFDADPDTAFPATISFISPLSSDVSGVAYYDAIITLTNPPDWLREGLNADVIIENDVRLSVPTIPKRFLITEGDDTYVLVPAGATTTRQRVTTGLIGTDGHVEVVDLPIGTTVLQP